MDVISQAPQPTIKCYHSIINGQAAKLLYQEFTPTSLDNAGKNLQSYSFENSVENFGGSFSFSIKEDIPKYTYNTTFMDQVKPLDIIVISERGDGQSIDFIGVVTKVSVGGISSNLNKTVTVSGKSIEWLFTYYNINCDIKACIFSNESVNNTLKVDLANNNGKTGMSIKDIVIKCLEVFNQQTNEHKGVSNFIIGDIIKNWYGEDYSSYIVASNEVFAYPISSNLFDNGQINIIDYLKKLFPAPLYEIYGYIDNYNKPKLGIRKAPFDNPRSSFILKPVQLTDFTLTRSCEEVYTAFMPYIEGSSMSPDFYMNIAKAEGIKEDGYNYAGSIPEKVKLYGYQLLTCSFVGYNADPDNPAVDTDKLQKLQADLVNWFGNLDDMYSGDFTVVNLLDRRMAKIGEWLEFTDGLFYVYTASHTWNYGDNPMINYQVGRGGKWINDTFKPLDRLSTVYREFE